MSDLDDLASVVAGGGRQAPPAYRRKFVRGGYRRRVGSRSFICQVILAVWTAIFAAIAAMIIGNGLFGQMTYADLPGNSQYPWLRQQLLSDGDVVGQITRQRMVEGAIWSCLCMGTGWAIVAVPLGITAIATMKRED